MAETKTMNDLDSLMFKFQKDFGKGTIQLGTSFVDEGIPRWSVSSPRISYVIGNGLPKGRIIEIYGPEASGKTSLACYLAGEVQKAGDKVMYIDAENAIDLSYAQTFGLNREELLFSQPNDGEQALDIAIASAESGLIKLIVIDSVAALTPLAELEGGMGDQQMGLQARMMAKGLRKLGAVTARNLVTVIFINQIRMKIGIMFGNPETTPGGKALRFWSSIRLETRAIEFLSKGKDEPYGMKTRLTSKKNKTAPPMRKGELTILFGDGFQVHSEYVDFAVLFGIIDKAGSWYSYKGTQIGQGSDNVVAYLKSNPLIFEEIKASVKGHMGKGRVEVAPEPETKTRIKRKQAKEEETLDLSDSEDISLEE